MSITIENYIFNIIQGNPCCIFSASIIEHLRLTYFIKTRSQLCRIACSICTDVNISGYQASSAMSPFKTPKNSPNVLEHTSAFFITMPSARRPVTAKLMATLWSPKVSMSAGFGCEGYIVTPPALSSHSTPMARRFLTIAAILSHSCPRICSIPHMCVGFEK